MASSAMSTRILVGLQELWETHVLSDITLIADGTNFPAHKTILALSSDYFMAMLTCNMIETTSNEIELKGVSAKGLKAILQYIYTGNLGLTSSNVCDIIMAARHLQMDAILDTCCKDINKVINVENCVDLKNVAKMCYLQDIDYLAEDYILDNFAGVMIAGGHCGLDLKSLLMCFFQERSDESDAILIGPEWKVFSLMVDWIKHVEEDEDRSKDVARVMEVVRFPLMTLEEIDKVIIELSVQQTDSQCIKQVDSAREYLTAPTHRQVVLQSRKTRIRNNPGVLAITTNHIGELQMHMLCLQGSFNPDKKKSSAKWLHLVDLEGYIPDMTLNPETVSSIVVHDFLVLVGAYDKSSANSQNPPKSCYVFNPRTSNWIKIADIPTGRHKPALVFNNNYLYAFGGALSLESKENSNSIERYDFQTNSWEDAGKMPAKLRYHSACVLEDKIFICGGQREGGTPSYGVYLYYPNTKDSESILPMTSILCENHQLHNINDKMYMVLPSTGALKTYTEDTQMWSKFWVRLGGPKVPHSAKPVRVGSNVVFVDGILEPDSSDESDSDNDTHSLYTVTTRHACVEVVVGDMCQGAGRAFVHEKYPAGLESPIVLAGIRLPWHLTNETV